MPNLRLNSWYMDDGSFFGNSRDVLKAWNIVKNEGPSLGLFPNISKCELISPFCSTRAFDDFDPEFKKEVMDMEILGSPIGSKDFLKNGCRKKFSIILKSLI